MRAPAKRHFGFTLIELMIAITLGLIILAALTSFFVRTSDNRRELERNSRQIENGRFAINALRDDLMLAGFYADITQPSTTVWDVTDACKTVLADMGWKPDQLSPQLPVPILVYPLGVGRPTGCTPDYVKDTDVIVIRRLNSEPVTRASLTGVTAVANVPYVQISECPKDDTTKPYVIATGADAPAGFPLKKQNCVNFAEVRRYREQLYYVRDYSVTAGDGIPTLVRVELDGDDTGTISNAIPLVDGIENLRVDWGIDNDGDGLPDVWSRCDGATPSVPAGKEACVAADWANVMAAKIYVVSRNLEATTGYKDDKKYAIGLSGSTAATNDSYRRHVYSAQINMPNRSGPREPAFSS